MAEKTPLSIDDFDLKIPESTKPRVVVIGGGFAGVNCVQELLKGDFQVVLFDRRNYHTFQPMLYQVATSGLEPDSISEPLRRIFSKKGNFYFRLLRVERVNTQTKKIFTSLGTLTFDYLIVATGAKTNFFGNESIAKYAMPLKSVRNALNLRSQFWQCLEKATFTVDEQAMKDTLTFLVVGGGPTGVEVAGAMAEMRDHIVPHDFTELNKDWIRIILMDPHDIVLRGMSDFASRKAEKYLRDLGVEIQFHSRVKSYDGHEVILEDGRKIETETVVWAAGVKGDIINGFSKDQLNRDSIKIDENLNVNGLKNIFAIGDIAHFSNEEYPRGYPGVAPVAIQQGRYVGRKLVNIQKGKTDFEPFKYKDKGSMSTVGRNKAVVDLPNNRHFGGFFAWIVWCAIHIYYLIGFRNKFITFYNWVESYFTYDKGTRLIIRPFVQAGSEETQKFIEKNQMDV